MTSFESARVAKLVRREEKQENLERFIGCYLDRLSVVPAPTAADRMLTVIARSPGSPIAVALLRSLAELRSLDVMLGVVFAKLEPVEPLSAWLDLLQPAVGARPRVALRWARNASLLDAHEQMVLGPLMTWSGDCMRRPPESRDAYELYDSSHEETARRASLSFRALWDASEALPLSYARPHSTANAAGEADLPVVPSELPASVSFGTRH